MPEVPVSPYTVQKEPALDDEETRPEITLQSRLEDESLSNSVLATQSGLPIEASLASQQAFAFPQESFTPIEQASSSTANPNDQIGTKYPEFDLDPLASPNTTVQSENRQTTLSTKSPLSPQPQERSNTGLSNSTQTKPENPGHQRLATMESTSWLDTIEESGGSSTSSIHSRSSSMGFRRKHIRTDSGDTEAQFDAALDAAVEAAYDDGYEVMSGYDEAFHTQSNDGAYLDTLRKNVDLAKQRVRDAERETALLEEREAAILAAREREKKRLLLENDRSLAHSFEDPEAEAEERMLDEMTRHYILEQGEANLQPKAVLPWQSDANNVTSRRLGSSANATSASAVGTGVSSADKPAPPSLTLDTQSGGPLAPPPTGALPMPPITKTQGILPAARFIPGLSPRNSSSGLNSPGVRDRRLSGQKVKELTINTAVKLPYQMSGPKTQPAFGGILSLPENPLLEGPKSASAAMDFVKDPAESMLSPISRVQDPSRSATDPSPLSASVLRADEAAEPPTISVSPAKSRPVLTGLRKNFSSSSLKSLTRSGSGTPGADDAVGTPVMRIFSTGSIPLLSDSMPSMPDLPTPGATNYAKSAANAGGLSYLDIDIHSPHTPGFPNHTVANPPVPLEPCPKSSLLRPFWLMRALYQTIAHPRGGYITTKLFIPRDTWRVMNVKLKNVDEKVANCDLLTAALMKLSKVDTRDADAVLEEMQAFELVMDLVQSQLTKKLGAEVGINGSAALFRSPPGTSDDTVMVDGNTRASSISSKSYLSWKRLRSKNSIGTGFPTTAGSLSKTDSKDSLTMRTLPMATSASPRFAKRDPTKVLGIGPHSHYMASLGRLCDAVQILGEFFCSMNLNANLETPDQITRQVEDPGLRHSSQTHVGLELCIRHAADFFAFFVCRFALNDIGMMLDKFIKRGSEWVLA